MPARRNISISNALPSSSAAAQYLRMSKEHQRYSTKNQADAIAQYAIANDFTIVRTYEDYGRSGLRIQGRSALQRLISDVLSGNVDFKTVLVYDVSRWGRFQDNDESAYYEYLCKASGISVQYCAEQFKNDGTLHAAVIKALKRAMAAEYSRELSAKVFAGQARIVRMGFHRGGRANFGLRRMMLSEQGEQKGVLISGQRKNLATDRVVLVPGEPREIQTVRRIFELFVGKRFLEGKIARILNGDGIRNVDGQPWRARTIHRVLTNEKYIGCNIFNKTTGRLQQPRKPHDRKDWIIKQGAIQPTVDRSLFDAANDIISHRTWRLSDEEFLKRLSALLKKEGRLSLEIIDKSREVPSGTAYRKRFGSIQNAYELVGYNAHYKTGFIRTRTMRAELLKRLCTELAQQASKSGITWSIQSDQVFCFNNEIWVRIVLVPCDPTFDTKTPRWPLDLRCVAPADFTLAVRLTEDNEDLKDVFALPFGLLPRQLLNLTPPHTSILSLLRYERLSEFVRAFSRLDVFQAGWTT